MKQLHSQPALAGRSTLRGSCTPAVFPALLGLAGLFTIGILPLRCAPPAEVYLFGDSASEMGNLFALPEFTPGANAPYWRGPDGFLRHSSGPKWSEVLFPGMRVSSDARRTGERINYAYDGALTNEWIGGYPTTMAGGLLSQVDQFAADVAAGRLHPRSDSAIVIDIGPNDYFEAMNNEEDPFAAVPRSATNIATSIRELAAIARANPGTTDGPLTFFVVDLPDFAEAPLFLDLYKQLPADDADQTRGLLSELTAAGREQTRETLLATRRELGAGVNIVTLPADALFTAIRAHPEAFGFNNVTDPVYDDTTDTVLVTDPVAQEDHLFVDWLHLTAKGERTLANYFGQVVDTIYGGPQQRLARITDTGFVGTDEFTAALTSTPRLAKAGDSHWQRFVGVSSGYRRATLPGTEGRWEYFPTNLTIGVENTPAESWSWGVGTTLATAPTWVDDKALRADLQGAGIGLFSHHDLGWATIATTASYTYLSGNVRRDPAVPTMKTKGSTHETIWSAGASLERSFALRSWTADLTLGARFARAEVAGYSETGAPGLNLRFDDFSRDSARIQLGARLRPAEWHLGAIAFRPALGLTTAYEAADTRTGVRALLLDNTADPTFGYADNGRRFRLGAAPELVIAFPHRMQLALRGRFETDTDDSHDAGGSCEFSYRF